MQCAVHNRATIRVVDRTGLSGRATAEVNLDRFHNRIPKVCALVAATLMLFAAAYAETVNLPTNQPAGKPIAELQAEVAALQTQVNAQQAQITSLQNQLVAAQLVLALAPFVSVDPNPENGVIGPNISFKSANIHILSGSGATNDNGSLFGLGNLIIGYDEIPPGGITAGTRGGFQNTASGNSASILGDNGFTVSTAADPLHCRVSS
jgi:hypothetical protein